MIGFLGLLLGAVKRGIICSSDARIAVDEAISQHGCRISVAVYQRILIELNKLD